MRYEVKVSTLRSDYSIVQTENASSLKTHLNGVFSELPTSVAQILADDINALPKSADVRESLVYCLLSSFCEEKQPNFQLFIDEDLQWDAAFRLSADEEIAELQLESIASLVRFLKDDYVNLAPNACHNIEEMREKDIDFVPGEIVESMLVLSANFNQYQIYSVELLQSIFGGIHLSMILLWVARKISSEDLMKSSLFLSCTKEDLESRKFSKEERTDIDVFSAKLEALRDVLRHL